MKVQKVTIKVGRLDVEVYQKPDGSYRLSKGQVTSVCGLYHKRYGEILGTNKAQSLIPQGLHHGETVKGNDV